MSSATLLVSDARRALILDQPFFGVLALKLSLFEDPATKTMKTNGKGLWFNPEYVAKLSRYELMGVVAHEVLHCANGHSWRREGRDPKLWNHACDYAINPIVLDAGMVLPCGALDGSPYKGKSAEEIYAHLLQQHDQSQSTESQNNDQGEGGDMDDDAPGADDPSQNDHDDAPGADDPSQNDQDSDFPPQRNLPDGSECGEVVDAPDESSPELKAEWDAAVLNAAKRAEGMGNLPAGMDRLVNEIKNPPQDWRSILRRFVQVNSSSDYSWRQPNSRYLYAGLYMPALRSETMPPMVVAVDTSGSIDDLTVSQFAREIDSIVKETQPERVYVVYCDDDVRGVDVFDQGETVSLNPKGYGGTDFRPVFEWVEKEGLQPSCLVYLTDMMGTFPQAAPDYPVLWGDTLGLIPASWGESVQIRCG